MKAVTHESKPENLSKVIGRRLRAARHAAAIPANVASRSLGYQNATQISLAEKGERIPPLPTLIQYAKLYAVPLDFLCGLIDDPIADSRETNQGIITHVLADAIRGQFERLVKSLAEQASITIAGYNEDRRDLQVICNAAHQTGSALEQVRKLNGEFDEDWRGTAKLVKHIQTLAEHALKASSRLEHERRMRSIVVNDLSLTELEGNTRRKLVELNLAD